MRVVIVDDEPLARSQMARLCRLHPDLDVVAQADSGTAAIDAIRSYRPDVVLMDLELQDMNGLEVIRSLDGVDGPIAIMVTAHPQYALQAFDTGAIDYLTKPIDVDRFGIAIERARHRRSGTIGVRLREEIAREVRATLADHPAGATLPRQLVGEKAHRLYFVEPGAIDYIESDANYVLLHSGADRYISRNSLKHLAVVLAPLGFRRIERSLLLNLGRVEFVEKLGGRRFSFALRGGQRLVSSAGYHSAILRDLRKGKLSGLERAH